MHDNEIDFDPMKYDHYYYSHGKVLISGEYFVLDGAEALALPTIVGQSLTVRYTASDNPILYWKSYDNSGNVWFESRYEFWHFNCLDQRPSEIAFFLQRILRQARKLNSHFLRDETDVFIETRLEFPVDWGLGSSSTLIYNMAQWAYVNPFELLFNIFGGSGYDIACAQSSGPIVYEKGPLGPLWSLSKFNPPFKDNLYFLYLGRKQKTSSAIKFYTKKRPFSSEMVAKFTHLTRGMEQTQDFKEFQKLMATHENMVAKCLKLTPVKEKMFPDYWGEIKSLGAWGGDFTLITSSSEKGYQKTKDYFASKGFEVLIPYNQLVLSLDQKPDSKRYQGFSQH
ncbi:MAG: GYDIA family GHMP kinase [Pseudomonadota bacterium]